LLAEETKAANTICTFFNCPADAFWLRNSGIRGYHRLIGHDWLLT